MARCELDAANGIHSECTEDECPYWRAVAHLDIAPHGTGCAIQHFGLLGDSGEEIAEWLQSVKQRLLECDTDAPTSESA